MVLPRPPVSANTPIPNQPFSSPEVYYLEGNQGHLTIGEKLYINPETGSFTTEEPPPPVSCTPFFSNIPVTSPPYGCNTEVNTKGVESFSYAWAYCGNVEFPCVDSSSVTDFSYAWYSSSLGYFPPLDTSSGENFTYSWAYTNITSFPKISINSATELPSSWSGCYFLERFPNLDTRHIQNFSYTWYYCEGLQEFPKINTSKGKDFSGAWWGCSGIHSFPPLDVSSGTDFQNTWWGCSNLTTFPPNMFDTCQATSFYGAWYNCSLSQESVDNILVSIDAAGQSNGILSIEGGTSSSPGPVGIASKESLEIKGWTVTTN